MKKGSKKKKNINKKKSIKKEYIIIPIILVIIILIVVLLNNRKVMSDDNNVVNNDSNDNNNINEVDNNAIIENNNINNTNNNSNSNSSGNTKNNNKTNNGVITHKTQNSEASNKGSYGDILNTSEKSLEDIAKEQKNSEELKIGIKKYLEFLWMVDGAFNKQRYNNVDLEVNGEVLKNHSFKCEYRDNKEKCYGVNFEDNYYKLFSNKIDMNRVYGDGISLKWYEKANDEYIFTNTNNCNLGRMSNKQTLVFKEKKDNKLIFNVSFTEEVESGIFKGTHSFNEEFVLIKEDGNWKVYKAYYHNPCYMEYIVE